jgi:hypothetical protein
MPVERRPSFANMPGQRQDSSARDRRQQLEELSDPIETLAEELAPDHIGLESEEHTTESYATATFVIEEFWEYLRELFSVEPLTLDATTVPGDTTAKRFVGALNGALTALQSDFTSNFVKSLKEKGIADVTKTDILVSRYFQLQHEKTGSVGFPSMKDLVTMIGRMADVIPEVYQRELGRVATEEELFASLQHPSLKRLFMEMMTNSKAAINPVFAQMEKGHAVNLDDYEGGFNPEYFTIERSDQDHQVKFKPEIAQRYREVYMQNAEQRAKDGKIPPRALQCPVLYTGKFIEMYDWVEDEFEKFYQAEKKQNEIIS